MTKEQEIMEYLHMTVFDPVLNSQDASKELKSGIKLTIYRMNQRDADGMIRYFWSAVKGTDRSVRFASLMKQEGFSRFEEALEEFRVRFSDNWLKS
jgi:hypothetical protein